MCRGTVIFARESSSRRCMQIQHSVPTILPDSLHQTTNNCIASPLPPMQSSQSVRHDQVPAYRSTLWPDPQVAQADCGAPPGTLRTLAYDFASCRLVISHNIGPSCLLRRALEGTRLDPSSPRTHFPLTNLSPSPSIASISMHLIPQPFHSSRRPAPSIRSIIQLVIFATQ